LVKAKEPDLTNLEHVVKHHIPNGLEVDGDDLRKLDEDSLLGQLKWLSSLIDAKKALRQIVSSSARILKLSEKSDVSEKSDLLPSIQFRLLPLHVIKEYGGLVVHDRLTAMGGASEDEPTERKETTWYDLMERFLFHSAFRSANGKAYDSIQLGPLAKEFVDAQHEFYDLSFLIKTEGKGENFTVSYPQELGKRITEAYEQMVQLLSRLPNLEQNDNSAISDFVGVSLFPKIHFGETLSSWIQLAKRVKLDSPELKTKPMVGLNQLDNFDKLIRLLTMFHKDWYSNDSLIQNITEYSVQRRGYTREELSNSKYIDEKIRPYRQYHRKSSGRQLPAPVQDSTNLQFWTSGREFLIQDTDEFRDALPILKQNFLSPLCGDGSDNVLDVHDSDLSTSPEQVSFLLQLARRSAELGSGPVIEEFITHLVALNKFARYEHMIDPEVDTLSDILPHTLPRRGKEVFSQKSFIQHVLDLTVKQFLELKSLFLTDAFNIAELFRKWVLHHANDPEPLSISLIYQITTLREHLQIALLDVESQAMLDSPHGEISSLVEAANIEIDWDTEIVAFRPYRKDLEELTKVVNKLMPQFEGSTCRIFYKHLLPAAKSYQQKFDHLPKAFIQHVLSLHRTWYHFPNTGDRHKRVLSLESLIISLDRESGRLLFSDWKADEITKLVGVFSDHVHTPLALDKEHFNPEDGKTTVSSWNVALIDELSERAKNLPGLNKKLFDDIKLKGMGVYKFAKEIILGRQTERLSLYGVSRQEADRWEREFERDDSDNNPAFLTNPITQFYIRQVIQQNRTHMEWWNHIFHQTDVQGWMTATQDIRIAENGAQAIDLKLSRFFGIVRFSQYLRTHLPTKLGLGDAQKVRISKILSTENLIRTFMSTFRSSVNDVKQDFERLLSAFTRAINLQMHEGIKQQAFHLETTLFGPNRPDYSVIVGGTDPKQSVNGQNLQQFGFVAALKTLQREMQNDVLARYNSVPLKKLIDNLAIPEDGFSINDLSEGGGLRTWTSIQFAPEND
jgi:hypothetical protein